MGERVIITFVSCHPDCTFQNRKRVHAEDCYFYKHGYSENVVPALHRDEIFSSGSYMMTTYPDKKQCIFCGRDTVKSGGIDIPDLRTDQSWPPTRFFVCSQRCAKKYKVPLGNGPSQ